MQELSIRKLLKMVCAALLVVVPLLAASEAFAEPDDWICPYTGSAPVGGICYIPGYPGL
jgi:hypothetical protein